MDLGLSPIRKQLRQLPVKVLSQGASSTCVVEALFLYPSRKFPPQSKLHVTWHGFAMP